MMEERDTKLQKKQTIFQEILWLGIVNETRQPEVVNHFRPVNNLSAMPCPNISWIPSRSWPLIMSRDSSMSAVVGIEAFEF